MGLGVTRGYSMQPNKSDSVRTTSSCGENSNKPKQSNNLELSTGKSALDALNSQKRSGSGTEIKRIFARMKMTLSSIVSDRLIPETATDKLLLDLVLGSELVAYEFDREIAVLCAAGHTADVAENSHLSDEISRRASALARGRNRVSILKRSVEILLDSTTCLLERYSTPARHVYDPFGSEGQGAEAVCRPYIAAINAAIDAIAESTSKAIKARDFHGAALLSALASNLNDFLCDFMALVGELFAHTPAPSICS